MSNSSFIQGFELDDYHPLAPLHSNSIILPAMLAEDPRVGQRLRRALPPRRHPRVRDRPPGRPGPRRLGRVLPLGWHSGVVFGPLASAAATGTLYGLDAAGFEDAFGMAATRVPAGSCGRCTNRWSSACGTGSRSRNGLTAAALAAAGYVGIERVFERSLRWGIRRLR